MYTHTCISLTMILTIVDICLTIRITITCYNYYSEGLACDEDAGLRGVPLGPGLTTSKTPYKVSESLRF